MLNQLVSGSPLGVGAQAFYLYWELQKWSWMKLFHHGNKDALLSRLMWREYSFFVSVFVTFTSTQAIALEMCMKNIWSFPPGNCQVLSASHLTLSVRTLCIYILPLPNEQRSKNNNYVNLGRNRNSYAHLQTKRNALLMLAGCLKFHFIALIT